MMDPETLCIPTCPMSTMTSLPSNCQTWFMVPRMHPWKHEVPTTVVHRYSDSDSVIRHSLWFLSEFFLLPPPRFPNDNFWPPSRTAPEFKPVTGHGHREECIVFWPRATPGVGRPKHPKIRPPPKFFFRNFSPPPIFFGGRFQLLKTSTRP